MRTACFLAPLLAPLAPLFVPGLPAATPVATSASASAPLAPTASAAVSTTQADLDLTGAISAALRGHETPALAAARVDRAYGVLRQARSLLSPTLSASGSWGIETVDDMPFGAKPEQNVRVEVAAEMSLFNGQALPGFLAARRLLRVAQLSGGEQRRLLAFAVTDAYLAVLAAERGVTAAERRRSVADQACQDARLRKDAGLIANSPVTRSELELANAELALTTTQRSAKIARLALADLIARDLPERAVLADIAPPALPPRVFAQLHALARSQRGDLAADRETVAARRMQVVQERGDLLPAVSVRAAVSDFETDRTGVVQTDPAWSLTFTARWTLFDGGLRAGRIDSSAADLHESEALLLARLRGLTRELATALADLDAAEATVRQAETADRFARENSDEIAVRFRTGLATALEAADASASAYEAAIALVRRKLDLEASRFSLRRVAGLWPQRDGERAELP